jgi:hypothetical protein
MFSTLDGAPTSFTRSVDEIPRADLSTFQGELERMPATDSIVSGRVCLFIWDEPIGLDTVVRLLGRLNRVRQDGRAPLIAIVLVPRETSAPHVHVRNALRGVLPAILDRCHELIVVVEGNESGRQLLRGMFAPTPAARSGSRLATRFFVALDDALAFAQRIAPHDTLAVQRALLQRKLRGSDGEGRR